MKFSSALGGVEHPLLHSSNRDIRSFINKVEHKDVGMSKSAEALPGHCWKDKPQLRFLMPWAHTHWGKGHQSHCWGEMWFCRVSNGILLSSYSIGVLWSVASGYYLHTGPGSVFYFCSCYFSQTVLKKILCLHAVFHFCHNIPSVYCRDEYN